MSDITREPPALDVVLDGGAPGDRAQPGDCGPPPGEHHEVVWATAASGPVVVKRSSGRGRGSLRREAEALRQIPCSCLVELLEVVDRAELTALVQHHAGDVTLAELPSGDTRAALAALQRTCEAIVELHAAGWAHGALDPTHVVVGARGSVRLCSLGSARPIGDSAAAALSDVDDLLALTRTSLERLRPAARSDRRDLRRLGRRVDELADRPETTAPRALAQEIASIRRGERAHLAPSRLVAVGAAVVFGLAGASALVSMPGDGANAAADPASPTTAPTTSTTASPTPDTAPDRLPTAPTVTLDGATFRVGLPGDLAVTGDWDCDGTSTVRLLRPATGELFEFDDPDAAPVTHGREIARLDGAVAIRALPPDPAVPPDGAVPCERTAVRHRDGSEQVIP